MLVFKKIIHRAIFKVTIYWTRFVDLPATIKYKFNVWKYGGKENVPDHVKEEFGRAICANISASMDLEDEIYMQFIGSAMQIKKIFNLEYEDSKILCCILNDVGGHLNEPEILKDMDILLSNKFPCKAFLIYLVSEGAVRQDQIDFHLNNNTNNLNEIISWERPNPQIKVEV